ncbi:DUF5989 family protein [Crocinitomix algicola]|uniref:DUF5989 family protein n=1 Tax=Crocinitomix algicola TaxID=1740263 RepID=UPI001FE0C70F|nr:DUF5989 family protein [Crocinitomix algicola]
MFETIKELFQFVKSRKKYWLFPIILILVFVGVILVFGVSTGLAPYIYPFF